MEFHKPISKEKVPQLARNLKNFLKAVNVDQDALKKITIAFLEKSNKQAAESESNSKRRPGHRRSDTGDFLVDPGETIEITKTFIIKGIPERYLIQDRFLQDMPEKVFEEGLLESITVPPVKRLADGSMPQTSVEIKFREYFNIQKLPKIAMKLKRFLKRREIPPHIVSRVTVQVIHGEHGSSKSKLESSPVVGLIFKGIPKRILETNESLYGMESSVFTNKHPIHLIEVDVAERILQITVENPISRQQDLTALAQRLKRFLERQSVHLKDINNVVVMSFDKEKWNEDRNKSNSPPYEQEYVGILIEKLPLTIVDSNKQLEEIERQVLSDLKVVHMKVLHTSLRISFGVTANTKAIEKIAVVLKRFLSKANVPMNQINQIVISPHTAESWERL